jgi:ABC-type lipoprotein release transport system permease subunit
MPSGVLSTNTNYDENYIFCPIEFVRELMNYNGEVTSVEVQLKEDANPSRVRSKIADILGDKYIIKDQQEQEDSLYKTMKSEKFMIYLILAFILILAAFNIIGALGMLILEKKTDTAVLFSMGASKSLIQRVFIYEGMMVSALGGLAGTLLGALICFLQQTFHIVKLGGGGAHYIIPYYPVQIQISDLLMVMVTILLISMLTSLLPAYNLKKSALYRNTAL